MRLYAKLSAYLWHILEREWSNQNMQIMKKEYSQTDTQSAYHQPNWLDRCGKHENPQYEPKHTMIGTNFAWPSGLVWI